MEKEKLSEAHANRWAVVVILLNLIALAVASNLGRERKRFGFVQVITFSPTRSALAPTP